MRARTTSSSATASSTICVSDLLCMFPLFASIYHYRLQHLAHHQFVNDPDRDPDVSQLRTSGHWLGFPLGRER